uniref:Amyloid beta like protein 1 n=1 Tax=Nothobranchius furzeri TaxID=105023 RepID=A0A8C6KL69_NOTFU
MFCGRQLLHMNIQTGQWEPDPQGLQGCFKDPNEILSYCQEMYPALSISHIEESKRPVTIQSWCKKGWGRCETHPFIVLPYRCLEGEYVSEALLVPDRCRFLHDAQMDACESYVYWHNIAKKECTAENLELHSYGMLLPCGDHFRGVEYVCCPGRGGSNDMDEADVEEEEDEVMEEEEDEEEDDVDEEEAEDEEEEEEVAVKDPEEYEYPFDSGPYQTADLDSINYEKNHKPTSSSPLLMTMKTIKTLFSSCDAVHLITRSLPSGLCSLYASVTTPILSVFHPVTTLQPTDGVDVYFENPVDDTEHANFLRAKTDLEERRMKRINEIMKEWAEADNQSKDLPKSERQALNEHFQSVLQTLEEQVARERQRLVETHLARVEAILNNNRRLALENYLTAVQSDPPQPDRVLQALKRYMAAEQKDRRHTLRHYQHIVAVDPQKAEQMKFQVYTHLHVIEERMNQSLALLFKDPTLAEELHADIQELVKAERGDISELMTTSFSETRTTEELLPAESEEEKDDEEEEERAFQNRPYPPRIGTNSTHATTFILQCFYFIFLINTSAELKQAVKPNEIARDELVRTSYLYKTLTWNYSSVKSFLLLYCENGHFSLFVKQPDALETFNRGAMVGLLVVAVAIAMVMVISLLLVRRKPYGTISHGIVEVDPMLTPEEKQLNKMQNHGYENPTYKFFEQMN